MAGILSLTRKDERKLHPKALKWFNEQRAKIRSEVPLDALSDADLNDFLSDDEKYEFMRCMNKITEGLQRCICTDAVPPGLEYDISINMSLLSFQVYSLTPMYQIGLLLKKVHRRKREKAEEESKEREEEVRRNREQVEAERRRKEEEEAWQAARKAVSPPLDDAREYLDKEEYDKFIQAALDAIEVYLEKGEDYLEDLRTFDYCQFLLKINNRKTEERRKVTASIAATEYNQRLDEEKKRLRALLCPKKRDLESCFKEQVKDGRYIDDNFTQLLPKRREKDFDRTIVDISSKKLGEFVSANFQQFFSGEVRWSYFPMPSAGYSYRGVPYLDFMFDVFAVVEIAVRLKSGQRNFGDYLFKLPWKEENGYTVLLKEPEFLGYHYFVLDPQHFGNRIFWQSIPLVLVKGLLNGETMPEGTTITAVSETMVTYQIPKFKGDINIPDNFAAYLKSIGSIDKMADLGIITPKVASISKSKIGESKAEQSTCPTVDKRGTSKKAQSFQLFSQGKGPSSPEVKALGLHKSTRFKYYNQYLSVHRHDN